MMKIISKSIIIFLLIAGFNYSQDITPETLKDKGVFMLTIGNDETLCVINTDYEKGAYWFVIKGAYGNREIGNNLSQLAEVHHLSLSPGGKYLAVLSVGEGHPVIEVIDMQKLRDKYEYTTLHVLDPYPGVMTIDRWEGSKLLIDSNVPLNLRKEDGRVDPDLLLPETKKFSLDVLTGKIESISSPEGGRFN
jgi:hypothetical protein